MKGKVEQAIAAVSTESIEMCENREIQNQSYYKGKLWTYWTKSHIIKNPWVSLLLFLSKPLKGKEDSFTNICQTSQKRFTGPLC